MDLDTVCLTAEFPDFEVFFALERVGPEPCDIGSAVMRFPPRHELMLRCARDSRAKGDDLRRRGATRLNFGELGASLFARLALELGYCGAARQPETCYPLHWMEAGKLYSPRAAAELRQRTANSLMLHLWNEILVGARLDKLRRPRRGSFLDELFERHRIEFPPRTLSRRLRDRLSDAKRAVRRARRRLARRF